MRPDDRAIVELGSGVVDEARRRAARTLPGVVVGSIIGALLGGPVGAFLGAIVGGGIGLSADLEEQRKES